MELKSTSLRLTYSDALASHIAYSVAKENNQPMHRQTTRIVVSLMIVLGGMLFLALGPGLPRVAAQDDSWRARFWNNRNLSGNPILERNDEAINFDWGGGRPAPTVNDDNFSVRWTRNVELSAGNYRFSATMDDGMRVWIDDQLLIDAWQDSQVRTLTADRVLSGGSHAIRVEYFEAGNVAVAKFSWQQIGSTPPGTFTAWKGEYFNNMNLSGQPSFLRDDPEINFNWSVGAPAAGIAADQFSVRWTRNLNFATGTYRFELFSDDGARLWVNNQLVIDEWHNQSEGRFSANVALSGATALRLEYFENQGRAAVSLSWNPPGGSPLPLPPTSGGVTTAGPWLGEYYSNKDFIGSPTLTRNDAAIDFNWGTGSPAAGIPVDRFAVRWTRTVALPAGSYRFNVFSDDGVRLWVNNQLVIDQWRDQENGNFSVTVSLPSGNIPIRLDYYENTGRAAVALSANPPLPTTPSTVLPISPPAGVPSATMTGALYLNVRSGPGVDNDAFATLSRGQTVRLTGYRSIGGFWIEIFLPDGRTGWVSTRYMTGNVDFSTLPVKRGL